jgi:ABC-type proline/glycine betaine transport system permease subunit
LTYTVTAVFVSLLFGVLIAWLVERTDIRGRNIIYTGMTVGLLIPTFFPAMGWLFLLHPRIGFLNVMMKQVISENAIFNIATPLGMGWVEGITLAPVVFIMVAANLRMADTTLEEAAKVSGANAWQLFKGIILPLSTPATLAAGFYVATIAVASFDVPAIVGLSSCLYSGDFYLRGLSTPPGFSAIREACGRQHPVDLGRNFALSVVPAGHRRSQSISARERKGLPSAALPLGSVGCLGGRIRRILFLRANVCSARTAGLGCVSAVRSTAVIGGALTIEPG